MNASGRHDGETARAVTPPPVPLPPGAAQPAAAAHTASSHQAAERASGQDPAHGPAGKVRPAILPLLAVPTLLLAMVWVLSSEGAIPVGDTLSLRALTVPRLVSSATMGLRVVFVLGGALGSAIAIFWYLLSRVRPRRGAALRAAGACAFLIGSALPPLAAAWYVAGRVLHGLGFVAESAGWSAAVRTVTVTMDPFRWDVEFVVAAGGGLVRLNITPIHGTHLLLAVASALALAALGRALYFQRPAAVAGTSGCQGTPQPGDAIAAVPSPAGVAPPSQSPEKRQDTPAAAHFAEPAEAAAGADTRQADELRVTGSRNWKCPRCGTVLVKPSLGDLVAAGIGADGGILGTATCLVCGSTYRLLDVYLRRYDIPATPPGASGSGSPCCGCQRQLWPSSEFDLSSAAARTSAAQGGLGFRCLSCGAAYCFGCLVNAPQHPATGGRACPKCGGAMGVMEKSVQAPAPSVTSPPGPSPVAGLQATARTDFARLRDHFLTQASGLPLITTDEFLRSWGSYPHETVAGIREAYDRLCSRILECVQIMERIGIYGISVTYKAALPMLQIHVVRTHRPNGFVDVVPFYFARTGENQFTFGFYDR